MYAAVHTNSLWYFQCDCGIKKMMAAKDIKNGKVKSCGCLRRETTAAKNKASAKYGDIYREPTGMSWRGMMARCYNKNQISYAYYGAVGIFVCEFIRATPSNLASLIGVRPLGKTLDRIDNLKGYYCGQCAECLSKNLEFNIRWATRKTQQRNTSHNRLFTINGETKCVTEWAEIHGINRDTMWTRVKAGKTGADLIAPVK